VDAKCSSEKILPDLSRPGSSLHICRNVLYSPFRLSPSVPAPMRLHHAQSMHHSTPPGLNKVLKLTASTHLAQSRRVRWRRRLHPLYGTGLTGRSSSELRRESCRCSLCHVGSVSGGCFRPEGGLTWRTASLGRLNDLGDESCLLSCQRRR